MQRMSGLEFEYWRKQYEREPFGYDIENFRAGTIAAAVTNMAGKVAPNKPVSPSQFYPTKPKSKPELTSRQREQLERKKRGRSKSKI